MKNVLLFAIFFVPFLAYPVEKFKPVHPFLQANGQLLTPSNNKPTQELPESIKNIFISLFEQCVLENKPSTEEFNKLAPQQKEELIRNLAKQCQTIAIVKIYRACERGQISEADCGTVFKDFKRPEPEAAPEHRAEKNPRVDNSPRREGKL